MPRSRNHVHGNTEYGYSVPAGNLFAPNVFNQAGLNASTNPHANYET